MTCLLESARSIFCAFDRFLLPICLCRKGRITNQFAFPNAVFADQFEEMVPNNEACARDLFQRRWPDGFVCLCCGSRNTVRLKRKRCVHQCRDCSKQTSAAGTFMHRSHVPLRSWHRALHIMSSHSNGMSALQLQSHLGLGSYKSVWMLVHNGFSPVANVQADETSIPYRLKGSEPLPDGRSREGRLMIAGAVEVFGENSPGCVKLRRIMDQPGPTLKAFLEEGAPSLTSSIFFGVQDAAFDSRSGSKVCRVSIILQTTPRSLSATLPGARECLRRGFSARGISPG